MKQNILVVFARGYSMTNDNGQLNEGVSLNYLLTDDLSPSGDKVERGIRFSKGSIPLTSASNIVKVPGLYSADFSVFTDAKGKINLKLLDVDFISTVELVYPDKEF